LVDGASVVVTRQDVDGVSPWTLYLENMDIAASLRSPNGDKNGQLVYTAAAPGSAGNIITVEVTTAPNQTFSITTEDTDPYEIDIVINLACDEDGVPTQPAYAVMDLINATAEATEWIVASLAPGSDGSAHMSAAAETSLAGGFDSATIGTVVVEHSPTGGPAYAGPWEASSAAGTAFSTLGANKVVSFDVDVPFRGIRITVSKGASNTKVVVSGIARKKGGL
jgi:hypothetical protein